MDEDAMNEESGVRHLRRFFRPKVRTAALAVGLGLGAALVVFSAGHARAQAVAPELPRAYSSAGFARAEPVPPDLLRTVFPGATRAGEFSGTPPAAVVFENDAPAGYLLSTQAVIGSVGFSGRPLDVLVGLGNDGRIRGAHLRKHNEPILVIGIPEERLKRYVASLAGLDVRAVQLDAIRPGARDAPDMIVGATISSAVIRDAVVRSARAVARSRGLFGPPAARLDRESFAPASWSDLLNDGSLAARRFTRADAGIGGDPSETFVTIHAGLLTPPRVGQNLLGPADFNALLAEMNADDQAILIAADGLYSFKGTEWVRSGVFERVEIRQGERTIRLTRERHRNVERLRAPDSPAPREIGIFVIPADSGFDPLAPWRLSFLVERENAPPVTLELPYRLPERYRLAAGADADKAAASDEPLWPRIWRERKGMIAGLAVMLVGLTGILVFQDWLTASTPRYRFVRFVFLAVTLVWLGWFAGAQLSVVNVLTFAHALLTGFHWEFFLVDPLIFVLWSYVAVTLLFWGRGVFCGWLCPFGALQELLNEAARRLRVPQIAVPFALHERLWPIKYIVFLGLFALSLHSTTMAVFGAEVEPFKTAIVLRFARAWPFVLYVALLLAAGLFVERFFCRYLCPLGAALAIPARLRMFEWLKRRHQCGRECHICAVRCTVQAIHPNGAINPNECI
ncbi:MAG: regulatory protein NosR [Rhodospirillales bacterium]|nr:regulatory protein NosR [Rhodospirillales bacterium]